jgi:hypothetical protein
MRGWLLLLGRDGRYEWDGLRKEGGGKRGWDIYKQVDLWLVAGGMGL